VSGVVESGYDGDLVEQLPQLTRAELRVLQQPDQVWTGASPLVGEVKFLEWSPAGGVRHATLVSVFEWTRVGSPNTGRKTAPRLRCC
jgi:hypothetical protein